MVVGLDRFGAHFADYKDCYVLIGGAATWLVLDEAGIEPRVTRDLDIVLCIEVLDPAFCSAFWEFIRAGGYEIQEKSTGAKIFYRFRKPTQPGFPEMLELFSRKPDGLVLGNDSHLTPIPVGEDVSSLSAILLDENYYSFLHQHKLDMGGLSIVDERCLIPLKARAWLDLTQRARDGLQTDSRDIKKHKNDVLRLYLILNPGLRVELPATVRDDLAAFLREIEAELTSQLLNQLGIRGVDAGQLLHDLRIVFGIAEGQGANP